MEPSAKKKKQILPELPYEIWNQILLCIPAKTVIRLKSVCKTWHDLINSRNFQVSHTDSWRNRAPTQLIAIPPHRTTLELLSLNLGSNDDMIPSNVRSSTFRFGDTLLDCHDDGLFLIDGLDTLYLYNPLTSSCLVLPVPETDDYDHWTVVYDPSTRGYVILGYTDQVSQFLVVSLRIDLMNGVCGGWKTGNWRKIWSSENLTLKFPDVFFVESISIDGKVHWLVCFPINPGRYATDKTGILTIDLATEEVIVTKCFNPSTSGCKLFKSNKIFYCLKEFYDPTTKTFELWAIDDVDNPKWVKHHEIVKIGHKMMNSYQAGIVKDENRLIMRLKNLVFIYDISLQKWHVLDIINDPDRDSHLMSINFSVLSWN